MYILQNIGIIVAHGSTKSFRRFNHNLNLEIKKIWNAEVQQYTANKVLMPKDFRCLNNKITE